MLLFVPVILQAQKLEIESNIKFLALGDSYTIGHNVAIDQRWPVQLISQFRKRGLDCSDAEIIATTGWRTDDLKKAIDQAQLSNTYNLVGLLIGVNNFYQGKTSADYAPQFEALLNRAIELAGGNKSHVFVLSIPDYGYTPFGKSDQQNISKGIDAFNSVNKSITKKLGVMYFDITPISRRGLNEPELVAGDGLHPSGKMYALWVQSILKKAVFQDESGDGEITGTENGESLGITIFPNPFHKQLILENIPGREDQVSITLADAKGSLALESNEKVIDGKLVIDTSRLSDGIYYYKLAGKAGVLKYGKVIRSF